MADNDPVKVGDGSTVQAATDLLSDGAKSPKVSLLKGDGGPAPMVLGNLLTQSSQFATFIACGVGYTAYATPQDMVTLKGSASKIVRVVSARLLVQQTTAAVQTVNFLKRSTADTGGTSTTPTPVPLDSGDGAATAVVNLYTVLPTLGTLVGNVSSQIVLTGLLTGNPGAFSLLTTIPNSTSLSQQKALTLRGVAEQFAINWGGAALPGGFTAAWELLWTESDS